MSVIAVVGFVAFEAPGPALSSAVAAHTTFNCNIRSKANGRLVEVALTYSGSRKGLLLASATTTARSTSFQCVAVAANQWAIMSKVSGRYVSAEFGYTGRLRGALRARATTVGAWEKYSFTPVNACSCYAIRAGSRYVSTEIGYSGSTQNVLRARATTVGAWEKYVIAPTTPPVTTTTTATTTTTTVPSSTTTTTPSSSGVCGQPGAPAVHQKVVVFSFENRAWPDVGGTQFQSVPYFHSLALQCSTFANYTQPDTSQNSATQYVGTWAGSTANTVRDDCTPGPSCQSLQDNIARQVRTVGLTARSYVEGATSTCSASGNAAKHIPALYFLGDADYPFCNQEVLPYSQFDPNNLADFSFITPTQCNDGHDCGNDTVNAWAAQNVQPVLDSAAYKAGQVTVFIWYDEDYPVPNMQLGIHAIPGVKSTPVDYGSTLRAWEDLLGLPQVGHAADAMDMRPLAGI